MATTYCDFAPGHPLHGPYHDTEYGFPQRDESVLFERLLLEINQAGLSWATILRKRDGFRHAYGDFAVDRVADSSEERRVGKECVSQGRVWGGGRQLKKKIRY